MSRITDITLKLIVHKKDINKCCLWNGNVPGTSDKQTFNIGDGPKEYKPDAWSNYTNRNVVVPIRIKSICLPEDDPFTLDVDESVGPNRIKYKTVNVTFIPSNGGGHLSGGALGGGAGWDGWYYGFTATVPAGGHCGCNDTIVEDGTAWHMDWNRDPVGMIENSKKNWGGTGRWAAISPAFWDQRYAEMAEVFGDQFNGGTAADVAGSPGNPPTHRIPLGWFGGVNSAQLFITVGRQNSDPPCEDADPITSEEKEITYLPFIPIDPPQWPAPLPLATPPPGQGLPPGTLTYYPWKTEEICVTTDDTATGEDLEPYMGTYKSVKDSDGNITHYVSSAGTTSGGRTPNLTVGYSKPNGAGDPTADPPIPPTFYVKYPTGSTPGLTEAEVNAAVAWNQANFNTTTPPDAEYFDVFYVQNRTGMQTEAPLIVFDVPEGSQQFMIHEDKTDPASPDYDPAASSQAHCIIDDSGGSTDPVSGDPGCQKPSAPDNTIEKNSEGTWEVKDNNGNVVATAGTGDVPELSSPAVVLEEPCDDWSVPQPLSICYWRTTDQTPTNVTLDPATWPTDTSGGLNHGRVYPPPALHMVPVSSPQATNSAGNCTRVMTPPQTSYRYPYPVGTCLKIPGLEGTWTVSQYIVEEGAPPFPNWGTWEHERDRKKHDYLLTLEQPTEEEDIFLGGNPIERENAREAGYEVPTYREPMQWADVESSFPGVLNTSQGYVGAPSLSVEKNDGVWDIKQGDASMLGEKIYYLDPLITGNGWKYFERTGYVVGFGFENSYPEGIDNDAPSRVIVSSSSTGASELSLPLWDFDDNQASMPWSTRENFFTDHLGGSYASNFDVDPVIDSMTDFVQVQINTGIQMHPVTGEEIPNSGSLTNQTYESMDHMLAIYGPNGTMYPNGVPDDVDITVTLGQRQIYDWQHNDINACMCHGPDEHDGSGLPEPTNYSSYDPCSGQVDGDCKPVNGEINPVTIDPLQALLDALTEMERLIKIKERGGKIDDELKESAPDYKKGFLGWSLTDAAKRRRDRLYDRFVAAVVPEGDNPPGYGAVLGLVVEHLGDPRKSADAARALGEIGFVKKGLIKAALGSEGVKVVDAIERLEILFIKLANLKGK